MGESCLHRPLATSEGHVLPVNEVLVRACLPNAVNYLFRLSVEAGPAEKAVAWFLVARVFADTCKKIRRRLITHYRLPETAVEFFHIPHAYSQKFVDGIARLVALYGLSAGQQTRLEQVATHILAYEKDFYDALL